ncbi:hypothetical protein PGQ11_005968 [Apiospora arundinis]|uniref:Uncharacterized protein n=1 Tax=Apiospora arundinis TaxID=335852 RepID=A0ABR2IRW9_9PEZI
MDRALASLRNMCSHNAGIGGDEHLLVTSGSAVAYACSYDGNLPCRLYEVNICFKWSGKDCGVYHGSFLHIPKWKNFPLRTLCSSTASIGTHFV